MRKQRIHNPYGLEISANLPPSDLQGDSEDDESTAPLDKQIDDILDDHAKVYARTTMLFITGKITEDERDKEWHHSDLTTKHALVDREAKAEKKGRKAGEIAVHRQYGMLAAASGKPQDTIKLADIYKTSANALAHLEADTKVET